jgi:hypothetical protein
MRITKIVVDDGSTDDTPYILENIIPIPRVIAWVPPAYEHQRAGQGNPTIHAGVQNPMRMVIYRC